MKLGLHKSVAEQGKYALDGFQRLALGGMLFLTLVTFVGANLHAILWQSSKWLVSTVLPSVVVELTNEERADLGESALRRSSVLDAAAQMKAQHMAKNEYFAHYAPDGTSPWYWFDAAGYKYAHAGENLAIHFTDSDEVVEAWMDSPTHRANIVSGKYTEIGVGTAKGTYDGYDTVYVVQLFGAPAAQPVVKTTPVAQAAAPAPTLAEAAPVASEAPAVAGSEVTPPEPTEVTGIEEVPDQTLLATTETPAASEKVTTQVVETPLDDVVVVERAMVATSSGLAVANIVEEPVKQSRTSIASLITKPNAMLQAVYLFFGLIVVSLLLASVVTEAKRTRYVQMAYGVALLAVMGGLWYVHTILTAGAVIV
ncbi:MAG: hypothetical protein RLZZ480_103 [Candidatus Parcubacteria bacterium]|jgi:uncharacterized membrane protein YqjE